MASKLTITVSIISIFTCSAFADDFNLRRATWETFSTNDTKKTHGITIQLSAPSTWKASDGTHPRVIKKWTTLSRDGIFAMLAVQMDVLSWFQKVRMNEQSLSGMVDEICASDSMTMISKKPVTIERSPAFIVCSKSSFERLGQTFTSFNYSLFTVYKGALIHICGSITDPSEKDRLNPVKAAEFYPIFLKFANSLVLPEKWQ